MFGYITRRIFQMIPTVLGVIIITFVLFNVVGGSPAAMTLGKNVSPKTLEDFDEQRGFNKPLLFGRWSGTRAYTETDFKLNIGSWQSLPSAESQTPAGGVLALAPDLLNVIPLNFNLATGEIFRWVLKYRSSSSGAELLAVNPTTESVEAVLGELPPTVAWRKHALVFIAPAPGLKLCLRTKEQPLEISALRLERKNNFCLDSQFVFYLKQLIRLDFGVSNYSNQRVSDMLRAGILPSLTLTVPIFFGSLLISILAALVCAFFRDTWLDRAMVIASVVLMSVNYLVWIIFGQYFLAYRARLFPIWGYESWIYLILPVLIGIFSGLGENVRFYRTIMLDELYKDYVRTAVAKGVTRSGVLFVHVLKNALIPILTNVVIAIPFLYTGSLLLEGFFGIPGLGGMSINALNFADVDVVRAMVFIGSLLYLIANLITDIAYALVDPRVQLR